MPRKSWPDRLPLFMVLAGKRHQIMIGLIALAIAALTVAPIELQRNIINEAIEGQDFDLLLWLAGLYLAAIIALQVSKYVFGNYQNWISQTTVLRMRKRLFPNCKDHDNEDGSGNAVAVLGSEADYVGEFVGTGFSDLVADGAKLLFAIGYMLIVEPLVTLVALAFFIPQIILVPLIQKRLNHYMRQRTDYVRDLSDDVSSAQEGDCGEDEKKRVLGDIFDNRASSTSLKYLMKALVNIINSLAPLSVLVFGGYMVIQGETTIGTIVAFTGGFERMSGPLRALVDYYRVASLRAEQYGKIVSWDTKRGENGSAGEGGDEETAGSGVPA
ncbi:putative ATPase [Ahrensia sp. R2A130]|nr:putative ATPase [Ahrensia sp. R2A130]